MTLLLATNGWDIEPWRRRFAALLPGRKVVNLGEPFDRRAVNYVAAWKQPHGSLAGLPNLDAIFSLGAGVDHLLADPTLPNVPLVRIVDPDLTNRMSEYVVLHCLMHLRQQRRYDRQQRERLWLDDRDQPAAKDVRVGILGLGTLGLDAAMKLRMMGFDVAGWHRRARGADGLPTFAGAEGLDAFLARTDILVALLPLTPETRGILARPLFEKLARDGRLGGPILINVARGGLQNEADILTALDDGTLQAASLDVTEIEPLPADSPLWTHPGIILTPHNAAISEPDSVAAFIAMQITRMEAGNMPVGLVDRAAGY